MPFPSRHELEADGRGESPQMAASPRFQPSSNAITVYCPLFYNPRSFVSFSRPRGEREEDTKEPRDDGRPSLGR